MPPERVLPFHVSTAETAAANSQLTASASMQPFFVTCTAAGAVGGQRPTSLSPFIGDPLDRTVRAKGC